MLSLRLALRALRWRAAASVTVFMVALIGITAAAVGPIYLHAVDETVLTQRLLTAPQTQRDLRIDRSTTVGLTDVDWHVAVMSLATQASDPRFFDRPVYSEQAPIEWSGLTKYATELAAIDDLCQHVHVVSGSCLPDSGRRDTVVTERTAQQQHITVGQLLEPTSTETNEVLPVRVVGIVAPLRPQGAYWAPWNYLSAASSVFDTRLPQLDAFFVSHATLAAHQHTIGETVSANLRLRANNIRLDDLPRLRANISQLQNSAAQMASESTGSIPTVASGLPEILQAMQQEMSLARTLVILSTVQLVLLAIVILYAVVAGTAAATGHEVALAKLRGRRLRQVVAQGVAQPVLLVLLAAPCSALLAWAIVKLLAGHLLASDASVAFPVSAIEVVGAATAASVVAASVAARRIIASPVGALLRRNSDPSDSAVGLLLVDAATVALAIAGVVELVATGALTSGRTNPLSAIAAIMLGAALGVVVVRLLPSVGRALVRRTSESPRLAVFLAVRQIVRRPAGARVIVLIGVALALATFAIVNWSVADSNRQVRALGQAGADTVLTVRTDRDVHDLRTEVDQADPSGHSMAAAVVQVDRSTPLLAVDTKRFDGVAAWSPGNSNVGLHSILTGLVPAPRPSIDLSDTALRLTLDITELPSVGPKLQLTAFLTGADHVSVTYGLGTVRLGRHSYRADVGTLCTAPCRVTGLALADKPGFSRVTPNNAEIKGTISAAQAPSTDSTSWQPVPGFDQPPRWRSDTTGFVRLLPSPGALGFVMQKTSPESPWPGIISADTPPQLPAVVATGTASTYLGPAIHDITSFGLDSNALSLDGVHIVVSLPGLDRTGVMIDFGAALAAARGGLASTTRLEVFVSPGAPTDMPAALAKHGVHVISTVHAASFQDRLDHTGPAYADGLFLIAAGVATALAIGATVLAGVTTARRRAYELAALEVAGVRPRTLRRSAAVEQGIVLVAGLLVGLAAGSIGARLALPSTPVFVNSDVGPPVEHNLPVGLLAILSAVLIVVFAATSWLIARVVARQASAGGLREAQT